MSSALNKMTVEDFDVKGKRVLVRCDFNVKMENGVITSDKRIVASLPTIQYLIKNGAKVILCSHLGRPKGQVNPEFSMKPVAARLSELLGLKVKMADDVVGPSAHALAASLKDGEVMLLENVRFEPGETKNDPELSKEFASLADLYVNDAFGAAHRAHASTAGVASYLPAYAGMLMEKEVTTLTSMLDKPDHPFVAILGGSKVSDKVAVIDALIDKCDTLIIGGGMCFTFLVAQGYSVGTSLMEQDWVERAAEMLKKASDKGVSILLPTDVVCADAFANDARTVTCGVDAIPSDMMGLDIGPESTKAYAEAIAHAKTVFWNGPMGVFEMSSFEAGTKGVALAVAANKQADTIIGGGDSVAAVNKFELADQMTFISTGGGASMELVQGEALPGVEALKQTVLFRLVCFYTAISQTW